MVFTSDIVIGSSSSARSRHLSFDPPTAGLTRQPTPQPRWVDRRLSSLSVSGSDVDNNAVSCPQSPGSPSSSLTDNSSDALAVVTIPGDKQVHSLHQASGDRPEQQRGSSAGRCSSKATDGANTTQRACTCHEKRRKCKQHAPGQRLKAKLKAAMLSLATGLSWSASCQPAFPVPLYPPIVA